MPISSHIAKALARRGVDLRQFLTLVAVYVKQDLRGGKTLMQSNKSDYIKSNWALLLMLGVYVMLGLFMSLLALADPDVFFYSIVMLSFTMFAVATAVVAESGNVIFNESEVDIIGHLPISARTLFAAKVASLLLFTLSLGLAANIFPAILGIFVTGSSFFFTPLHVAAASLMSLFSVALIVVCYGLLMRYVSRERFDSIVTYGQVVLLLAFMLGFQVVPRLAETHAITMTGEFQWYYLLFPPAWFSGLTMTAMGRIDPPRLAMAALAIASLLALVLLALQKISAGYLSFISQLAYGPARPAQAVEAAAAPASTRSAELDLATRRAAFNKLAIVFLRRPVERAVFDLVSSYLRRSREIKIRLYPSLGYFIIFPLIAVISEGIPDPFVTARFTFPTLMGPAMICFVGLTAVEALIFSDHYRAAYIFRLAPIASIGEIHNGIRKAIFVFVALPGFAVLMIFYSAAWRNPLHALLMIAPWFVITPTVLLLPFFFREVLPLSRKYQKGQQSARNLTITIVGFLGLSLIIGLQAFGLRGRYPYWLFLLLVAAVAPAAYAALRRLSRESRPLVASDSGD